MTEFFSGFGIGCVIGILLHRYVWPWILAKVTSLEETARKIKADL